jgi:hypothetical protein
MVITLSNDVYNHIITVIFHEILAIFLAMVWFLYGITCKALPNVISGNEYRKFTSRPFQRAIICQNWLRNGVRRFLR